MKIEYDRAKPALTLQARDLDMAAAAEIFATELLTIEDDRQDYGETRFATFGFLDGRMVVIIWTTRGAARRIISLRKANDREQARFRPSSGP